MGIASSLNRQMPKLYNHCIGIINMNTFITIPQRPLLNSCVHHSKMIPATTPTYPNIQAAFDDLCIPLRIKIYYFIGTQMFILNRPRGTLCSVEL